ncbi:MAG: hypothetical protein AMXMBFR78_16310 [Rubrivivax sp.]
MKRRRLLALPLLVAGPAPRPARAQARTLHLRRGDSLPEVLARARDGDTVELAPGAHHGQAAVIAQHGLRLRAPAGRAVLHADGAHAEGKALLVVRASAVRIEGLEFRGARVPAGNGAGIRFERGELALRDCAFFDNEMGLLSANRDDARLDIEACRFGQAPRHEGMLHHLLYVGRIAHLRVRHSDFSGGWRGHLLKSRAAVSEILCNRLVDGEDGEASYEIDLPNGGLACVRGNLLGKSARAQNLALLAYGAEGNAHPQSRLRFEGNHAFSDNAQPVYFVRHWPDRLPGDAALGLRDNVFVGAAQPGSWGRPEDGNRLLPDEAREQALREQALREQALQVPPCAGACPEQSQPPAGAAAASSPGSSASTP